MPIAGNVTISFVVPALNEERHIAAMLGTIAEIASGIEHEVILADNGSTDSTADIAQKNGARVFRDSSLTIGGLRNLGARNAHGELLVFLDADMHITPSWRNEIENTIPHLRRNPRTITGSRAGISIRPSWIERYWFLPMTKEKNSNYINSGHLIIRKDFFNELGGFDEKLRTGEDWEFCGRARKTGASIVNNPALHVIHEGYPKSLQAFIQRERWHGVQDFSDLKTMLSSLPAKTAVLFWGSWLLGIAFSIFYGNPVYLGVAVVVDVLLCLTATLRRRRQFPLNIPYYFIIFHAYLFARGLSLKDRILAQNNRLHR